MESNLSFDQLCTVNRWGARPVLGCRMCHRHLLIYIDTQLLCAQSSTPFSSFEFWHWIRFMLWIPSESIWINWRQTLHYQTKHKKRSQCLKYTKNLKIKCVPSDFTLRIDKLSKKRLIFLTKFKNFRHKNGKNGTFIIKWQKSVHKYK